MDVDQYYTNQILNPIDLDKKSTDVNDIFRS